MLLGPVHQLLQGGVLVGLHLEDHTLVVAGPGDSVHFKAIGLKEVQALLPGQADDLPGSVVVFHARSQVELAGRYPYTQGLKYGIPADDQVIGIRGESVGTAPRCQARVCGLSALRRLLGLVCLVIYTILGLGGGPLASKLVAVLATRTLGRAFLHSHVLHIRGRLEPAGPVQSLNLGRTPQ